MKKVPDPFLTFASLDDLIAMKEAAGRQNDREDLAYLREIRDRGNNA